MTFNYEDFLTSSIPYCHIVTPMMIVPAVLTKTVIFPGSLIDGHGNIASILIIWLGASIALGRGWCGWVCFFGGFDEGFTYLSKKNKYEIDKKWTYVPYAMLIAMVLISAGTLSSVYCEWICPFKMVTEFVAITSVKILIQTIIFSTLFFGLVVILPILTGKRSQCTILCPLAGFQAFMNKINIYEVKIDAEKCKNCKKCIGSCPTLSMDDTSHERNGVLMSCTKCSRCIDVCSRGAISYHIKGTEIRVRKNIARNFFLCTAFIFSAAVGGGMVSGGVFRFLKLITTGSMI